MELQYRRYGIGKFRFNDNLVNGKIDTIKKLCNLIISSPVPFEELQGPIQLNRQVDEEMVRLYVEAGFRYPTLALESGSETVRKSMLKYGNQEHVIQIIRWFIHYGAKPKLNIMFCYPTETEEDFFQSLEFLSMFTPEEISWEFYPFNLSCVTTGDVPLDFIKKYDITLTRTGPLLQGTNQFAIGLDWYNENINPTVLKNRIALMKIYNRMWLEGRREEIADVLSRKHAGGVEGVYEALRGYGSPPRQPVRNNGNVVTKLKSAIKSLVR